MKAFTDLDLTNHRILNQALSLKTSYFRGASGGFWDTVNMINGGGNTTEAQTFATESCLVVLKLRTGTASNGGAQARQTSGSYLPEVGVNLSLRMRCKVQTLSTATDEFTVTLGFMNSVTTGGTVSSGYILRYNRTLSSNWLIADGNLSVDTGIAVTTNWFTATFIVTGTTCAIQLDESDLPVLSRVLPAAVHAKLEIVKTAGTNSRELLNDYAELFLH
jgi:hypothetical protein